jgi:Predicted dioxygenase
MVVRPSAVAGQFYPGDADRLRKLVSDLLANIAMPIKDIPKALIAPHAGYVYSGATAAAAFATLRNGAQTITRVVLIGPAHYVHVRGIAAPTVDAFETPLGRVPGGCERLGRHCRLAVCHSGRCRPCSRARSRSWVAVFANSPRFLPSGTAAGRWCDTERNRTGAAPAVG